MLLLSPSDKRPRHISHARQPEESRQVGEDVIERKAAVKDDIRSQNHHHHPEEGPRPGHPDDGPLAELGSQPIPETLRRVRCLFSTLFQILAQSQLQIGQRIAGGEEPPHAWGDQEGGGCKQE